MSNIYKEVFLAAIAGHCTVEHYDAAHIVDYSKQVADVAVGQPEIMAKIKEAEGAEQAREVGK